MSVLLIAADGTTQVTISRAAASMSEFVYAQIDSSQTIATSVDSCTLRHLVAVAEQVAARVRPGSNLSAVDPLGPLRNLTPQLQIDVVRAARRLELATVAQLAIGPITAILRGRSADVLRVVLSAPDDLSAEQKRNATEEPLFMPPAAVDSASNDDHDHDDPDDAILATCLHDLDARSLRTLKTVSRAWQQRARRVLGDRRSAWRRVPEWSAGAWAVDWFGERLESDDEMMRKRGLLALDALEAAVELPHFLGVLVRCLRDEERSSHRALALRALSRLEALTLVEYADELQACVKDLPAHERETDAACALRQKLAAVVQAADGGKSGAYIAVLAAGGLSASLGSRAVNKRRREEEPAAAGGPIEEKKLAANDLRRRLAQRRC